ncbi:MULTISPECIES: hypothetical protein [Vagococcus]|uniref:Uncharacterized protein n=1 Tax=Vagococcus fluvialis bH819 TaxID=1255619 RepID=A0A1X6WQV0_9ENTE|nr:MULTISPECIES: hypothetical protein [Vagococcus]SLM86674.1 hypothetical protein FM121_11305 [Vagococcus fluvialis bH819]HCM90882.1 hypothetical protein [Vagococcus sp.]
MNEIKELFKLEWAYRNFKASLFINGLIFYLGRIPIIGKIVPTTMLYREYNIKKAVAFVKLIMSLVVSFGLYSIPFVISYLISKGLNSGLDQSLSIFSVWFIVFIGIFSCIACLFPMFQQQEVRFINNFRISKEQYIKRTAILNIIKSIIFSLPSLIILGVIEKNIGLYLLIGIFSEITLSLFWSVINLHITLFKKRVILKIFIIMTYLFLMFGSLYVLYKMDQFHLIEHLTINWLTAFIWVILSFPFFYLYVRFNRFEDYSRQIFESSETVINDSNKQKKNNAYYLGEGHKTKLEKAEDDNKLDKYSGSKYLNALLFNRFKTTLRKQLFIRLFGISIVMLSVIIVSQVFPIKIQGAKLEEILYNLIPIMFFILYMLSFGKKMVQTLFVNCDYSMLAYPFYRESKAIISGFFYRFFKTFYYNGIISLFIYFWFVIFNEVNHQFLSPSFMLILLFVMTSLTILFSFHELFIYYILQPFTSDFQVKNPIYKVVDGIFYGLSYLSLQLKSVGLMYGVTVSVISIFYFVIGLFIIIKFAPKTFKLKN